MSAMLIAGLLGFLVLLSGNADTARAAGVAQGQLVPETARRNLPVVLDGRVLAHAQVGDRIFVAGDFQQVELTNGSVIAQPYLFAYDVDTGIVDPNFRPVVDDLIRTLEPTQDGNGLYVGGLFTRWDDSFPLRVARLDAEGNLDNTFGPRVSARVQGIVEIGDSVYIAGDFTDVSGVAVTGLAKVDRVTGIVDSTFTPAFTNFIAGTNLVRSIEATPDGSSFFVLHFAGLVDGQVREAIAKFDIDNGTPSLSGWNVPWSTQTTERSCHAHLRDLAISPSGSFLVVGGQGADVPPNCDSVLRYSTAGDTTVHFDWSARMYSSVFSLAVSDVAVYVGGHFCAAPRLPAPPGGVTSTFPGTANLCHVNDPLSSVNPSQIDPEGAVFRSQMAALNPANGQALQWDPGSNNDLAVFDLTLTERGLLAGQDGDRFSTFQVGRSGFFDITGAGPDTSAPQVSIIGPAADTILNTSPTELTGTSLDDREVVETIVRLRSVTTGLDLQTNGTFSDTTTNLAVNSEVTGLGQVAWTVPVNNLPAGTYEIRTFARDAFGNTTSPTTTSRFIIAGTANCTVALDDDGQPELILDQFLANGLSNLVIRRNESFLDLIEPDSTSYVDESAQPGTHSYVVRWRPDGVRTDVACNPTSITIPNPAPATSCDASVVGGNVVVNWDIDGVDRFQVRDDDGWVATITDPDTTTFTDTNPETGDRTYVIRYRDGGATIDLTCSPHPLTVGGATAPGTCDASVVGDTVVLSWNIDDVDRFQVRDDDGWVATINDTNATTFTDTDPGTGDRTYVVRYRGGGTTSNITCSPTVNVG